MEYKGTKMVGEIVEFLTADGLIKKGVVVGGYLLAKQEFFVIKEIDSQGNYAQEETRILSDRIISSETQRNKAYEYAMRIV